MPDQLELQMFKQPVPEQSDVDRFIELLFARGDWLTANQVLDLLALDRTEAHKRRLRLLANLSNGYIASGQTGYKHVQHMTNEEYNHFRNWMKAQSDQMTARILRSDRIFYARAKVTAANGILEIPDPTQPEKKII